MRQKPKKDLYPPPEDPEQVKLWTDLMDPSKTSIERFMKEYRVPTKIQAKLVGTSSTVPFRFYPLQKDLQTTIEAQWAEGQGGQVMVLKPRQRGITTWAVLLFWERFCRGGGGTWNLYSYDDDAVKEMFRLFSMLRKQTPEWVFYHVLRKTGGEWKKKSAKQLMIEFPDGEYTLLQCITGGEKASGSGSAPRGILWDEFSKWNPLVKQDPTSMSEGYTSAPGNLFIIPSTGQGEEEFAQMFRNTYDGVGESGFKAIFGSWLGYPDCRVPLPKTKHEQDRFIRTVGHEPSFGPKEETRLVEAGASYEEIRWRRRRLSEVLNYNQDLFRREYPITVGDAFSSASRTVFVGYEDTIKSYYQPTLRRERQAKIGGFEWDLHTENKIVFHEYPHGAWTVFEEPRNEEAWYCFGADSTSGKRVVNMGHDEADFAVAMFDDVATGRTVARYRAHTEGRAFAREIFMAAMWYRGVSDEGAIGIIENNSYGLVTIHTICDLDYDGIGGEDLLIKKPLGRWEAQSPYGHDELGLVTTKQTKELMIDATKDWLKEVGPYKPEEPLPCCNLFVSEAMVYERVANKTGKSSTPEARRGHDDCVMAKMMSVWARKQIMEQALIDLSVRVSVKVPQDPIDHFWAGQRAQATRRKKMGGMSQFLGTGF